MKTWFDKLRFNFPVLGFFRYPLIDLFSFKTSKRMQLSPEFLYLFSYALIIIMKIVCFIISYKVVKLGYDLVKAGVKGEFKFSSNFIGFKADLASVSPGLLFVLLGVLFMVVAVTVNKTIIYKKDASQAYINPEKDTVLAENNTSVLPDMSDYRAQFKKDTIKKIPCDTIKQQKNETRIY